MRNPILESLVITAIVIVSSIDASAIGIGAYGMFGYGENKYVNSVIPFTTFNTHGIYIAGGGIVVDTNCSTSNIFNYRITIGASQTFSATKHYRIEPEKTTRVQVINTLGLGILRTQTIRLWIGPQVGFVTLNGSYNCDNNKRFTNTNSKGIKSLSPIYIEKLKYSMTGGSFGLGLGVNFNFKKNITFYVEGSWRYDVYYGMKRQWVVVPESYSSMYVCLRNNKWIKAFADGLYLSLGIMCRFGESEGKNDSEQVFKQL